MPARKIHPAAMLMPVACLSLLLCFVAPVQADNYLTAVTVETEQNATNGIADSAGYRQVFTVDAAAGILSIPITTSNNQSYSLTPDMLSTHWEYDSQRYTTLAPCGAITPREVTRSASPIPVERTRPRCRSTRSSPPPPVRSSSPFTRPPSAACLPVPRGSSPGRR